MSIPFHDIVLAHGIGNAHAKKAWLLYILIRLKSSLSLKILLCKEQ